MSPQCQLVLDHLKNHGSLSPVEAAAVYRIRHLPRRIADLKAAGWDIDTEIKKDATGQRYARYRLAEPVAVKAGVSPRILDAVVRRWSLHHRDLALA